MKNKKGYCQCELHAGNRDYQTLVRHHVAPVSEFPELKDDPKNALFCCRDCHLDKIHVDDNTKTLSPYAIQIKNKYLRSKGYKSIIPLRNHNYIGSGKTNLPVRDLGGMELLLIVGFIFICLIPSLNSQYRFYESQSIASDFLYVTPLAGSTYVMPNVPTQSEHIKVVNFNTNAAWALFPVTLSDGRILHIYSNNPSVKIIQPNHWYIANITNDGKIEGKMILQDN